MFLVNSYTWDAGVQAGLPLLLEELGAAYIYGPGGLLLESVQGTSATDVYYYHQDRLGSVRALTNSTGQVEATYEYDAYGNPLSSTGSIYNPFGYTGEYTDEESGLVYLRARYYDPTTQQFLTVDPALSWTEQAYAYVGGTPTNYSDPSGLAVDCGPTDRCWPRKTRGLDGRYFYLWEDTSYSFSQSGIDRMWVTTCTLGEMQMGMCTKVNNTALGLATGLVGQVASVVNRATAYTCVTGFSSGRRIAANYPSDWPGPRIRNWSAWFNSERDARSLARTMLGSNPVQVAPNKWRSLDGKWQYRAKPAGDVDDNHIHLEELNPMTGEVLQNLHLRWK